MGGPATVAPGFRIAGVNDEAAEPGIEALGFLVALPLAKHPSPSLVRVEAGAIVLSAHSVRGRVIDPGAKRGALPEFDSCPLIEEAHRQGHPAPMLDGARH